MSRFLGLDTSNYTTSAAVYDAVSGNVAQAKQLLPVKEGSAASARAMQFSTTPASFPTSSAVPCLQRDRRTLPA